MIFGRQTNLVLGAVTAIFNLIVISLAALQPPIIIPAIVVGAANIAIAALIGVIANGDPTVKIGSNINIVPADGVGPNKPATVTSNTTTTTHTVEDTNVGGTPTNPTTPPKG
jgi:hypothetical protein